MSILLYQETCKLDLFKINEKRLKKTKKRVDREVGEVVI